jgi:hypothetical protein
MPSGADPSGFSRLSSNREYSVLQVKMLLNEIEHGIDRKITIKEWGNL